MVRASVAERTHSLTHTHAHSPAGVWGSGGVNPTLGQRPAPLSLSCGPVNEEVTYGLGTLVRQAGRETHTLAPYCGRTHTHTQTGAGEGTHTHRHRHTN